MAYLYIRAVIIGGAGFLVWLRPWAGWSPDLASLALFTVLTVVAELKPVELPEFGTVSVAPALHSACYVMFPPGVAAAVAGVCSVAADVFERRPPHKTAFNFAQYVICVGLAGLIFRSRHLGYPRASFLEDLGAFAAATLVYYLLNVGMVCTAFALTEGISPGPLVVSQAKVYSLQYLSLAALGMLIARVYAQEKVALLLLALPVWIVYSGLRNYTQLRTETREAMEALADAIDRRDRYTFEHSMRVAEYTCMIARRMALPEGLLQEIRSAARVHDLGKVGISDQVLHKPGQLNSDEWSAVRLHPVTGSEIAGSLRLYRRCASMVRAHHENYDGTGYPDGLKGEEIPIGARIIRVADAYDAMTTDRIYRKALSHGEAVEELKRGADKQFDRAVVEALVAPLGDVRGAGEDVRCS